MADFTTTTIWHLDVLIRKAQKIRHDLGIAVPVPVEGEQVIQTIVENVLLLRKQCIPSLTARGL